MCTEVQGFFYGDDKLSNASVLYLFSLWWEQAISAWNLVPPKRYPGYLKQPWVKPL